MDRSVSPCDDFYRYACGGWLARTPIPPDRPAWSRSFSEIQERNQTLLKGILEDYAAGHVGVGEPDAKKVGDFYAACMDEPAVERASAATLRELFARIDGIKDSASLATQVRWLQDRGFDVFFGFGADQDFRDATQVIGQADQGGLGLPDRDYYLKDDAKTREIRDRYEAHVARMMELAGEPADRARAAAATVMRVETALAKASMDRAERRDPLKIYHRIDRKGLEATAPQFVWKRYFTGDLAEVRAINVLVPEFFKALGELLAKTKLEDLKTYLRWHAVSDHAGALAQAFVDEEFAFSRNLTGAEVLRPRWKRCIDATDAALGEAMAQPFVARTFGAEGKQRSVEMIKDVEASFEANLGSLDWMDAPTRAAAAAKARRVFNKIGYPDKWRRYDAVDVHRDTHVANVMSAAAFESARQAKKIGRPVDRAEWFMTPPTVNAYYNAQLNEMVFPAGILQPPFFSREATDAANYGAIGMVMGHELTHGFDDEGRKFDGDGNLREWWTAAVGKAYEEKAACVVAQYDKYEAVPGVTIKGALTLGENIADMGGIKIAFGALSKRSGGVNAAPATAGLTPAQQFFVSYAQAWCTNRRPEYARMLATVDPHSPPQFRVNGPLRNFPAFAETFQCKPGAPMAPKDRCAVW
jgi:endothelin-converting enzyme/putative endopeptidase